MGDALKVTGLSVRLGRRLIPNDLHFSVPTGSTLAVIGPNGSGKTVLLKARPLSGFDLLHAKARAGMDEPGEEGIYARMRRR